MHVPGIPLTFRKRLPNEALHGVRALDSVPTRPGVSIHTGTQLQNYRELIGEIRNERKVHKNSTLDDLRNWWRQKRVKATTARHRSLRSPCARLLRILEYDQNAGRRPLPRAPAVDSGSLLQVTPSE